MIVNTVDGKDKGRVMLYALSTCGWCKKTKRLLEELEVAYQCVDVDIQSEEDQAAIDAILEKYNPDVTFPTMIINDEHVIKGFDMFAIRGAFE